MGNPAGEIKKKREKRHAKHMLQLDKKYGVATPAPKPGKPAADAKK